MYLYERSGENYPTPLHAACRNGQVVVVKYMLNEGVNPSCKDEEGNTPLHFAAQSGWLQVVQFIVENYEHGILKVKNRVNRTPMQEACANSHFHIGSYLISRTEPNLPPVLAASKLGNLVQLKEILNDGQGSLDDRDEYGNTPLHLAAQSGWLQVVQFIVENYKKQDTPIEAKNWMNRTPLQEACTNSHFHIGSYLISYLEPSLSPVLAASKRGNVAMVKYILNDAQSSLDSRDRDSNTPLHLAVKSGNCKMVKYIINTKSEQLYSLNKHGHIPLQIAIKFAYLDVIRCVLQYPNWHGEAYESPLMQTACNAGHLAVLKCLVQEFHFHPDSEDNEGRTPLFSAASAGNFKIIEYLRENHCNLNKVSKHGDTPLHIAALKGHTNIVMYLLSHHCKTECDEFSWSALHAACQGGHLDVSRCLVINAGIDPFCVDKQQNIPLHYAASSGSLQLVKYLTDSRKSPRNPKNNQNNTPLHNAAVSGRLTIVQYLIEAGNCTPDERGYVEQTPLHYACQSGHYAVVKYLVEEQKVNASLLDERGCSALDVAAGYEDITTYLSEHLQSIENPPTKKLKLDSESDTEEIEDKEIDTADAGPSTTEDDDIDLVTPAKRPRLTTTQKRKRLFKNVSWMPSE